MPLIQRVKNTIEVNHIPLVNKRTLAERKANLSIVFDNMHNLHSLVRISRPMSFKYLARKQAQYLGYLLDLPTTTWS